MANKGHAEPQLCTALTAAYAAGLLHLGASAEITTAFVSLGTGGVTFSKLTPGMVSLGQALATIVAQQTAISSFPLGAALGTLWCGLFPTAPLAYWCSVSAPPLLMPICRSADKNHASEAYLASGETLPPK